MLTDERRGFRVIHLFAGWTATQWRAWWRCRPRFRDSPEVEKYKLWLLDHMDGMTDDEIRRALEDIPNAD